MIEKKEKKVFEIVIIFFVKFRLYTYTLVIIIVIYGIRMVVHGSGYIDKINLVYLSLITLNYRL